MRRIPREWRDGIEGKACRRCYEWGPLGAFHRDKSRWDGRAAWCKACVSKKGREYRAENPEYHRERRKSWQRANPDKAYEYVRRWREAHPEKVREYMRLYARRHPDKVQAKDRRYREKNRGKRREQTRQWSKANPVKRRVNKQRRRARLMGTPANDFTLADWQAILEHYDQRCAYCGIDSTLSQDHIIPLSRGGPHTISNIVPACGSCNSRKGAKVPSEAEMLLARLPLLVSPEPFATSGSEARR